MYLIPGSDEKISRTASMCSLLFILICFISCNREVKSGYSDDVSGRQADSPILSDGRPKLVKTHGSDRYDNIHCALMDKNGGLWFGTTGEGVYHYNGRLFFQLGKEKGLNSNTVWSILEDRSGNIWIGTDSGVCVYDGKAIRQIPLFGDIDPSFVSSGGPAKNEVWSMMQDKDGKIWFGTTAGIYCYDGHAFKRFPDADVYNRDSLHLKMVDWMIQDRTGKIWFASGMPPGMEGLCCYDGTSLIRFKPGGESWIRYILEDKAGKIWLGTRHKGVWNYNGKSFSRFREDIDLGVSALVDRKGNIWFGGGENKDGYSANGGLYRYDGKSLLNLDTSVRYGVWCILEDRSGNIWLGTRNTDLYRYDGKSMLRFSE